jgi:DNA-binding MarR family transcriptional regulator
MVQTSKAAMARAGRLADVTTDRRDAIDGLRHALLSLVRRAAVPRAHEQIAAHAGVQIEMVEAVALGRLVDCKQIGVSELARQLQVECSTASRHAANLVRRGLVRRDPDPGDARAVVLSPTDAGRDTMARLRVANCEILEELLAEWPTPDVLDLTSLAQRLSDELARLAGPVESPRTCEA